MSRVCQVTGIRTRTGNSVSHANNKTKRQWKPNLVTKRYYLEEEDRWISLRVSVKGMKVIDKRGIVAVVQDLRRRGIKV
jgi:large subunit ribosomal protein L28